jgi:hypothetical protein
MFTASPTAAAIDFCYLTEARFRAGTACILWSLGSSCREPQRNKNSAWPRYSLSMLCSLRRISPDELRRWLGSNKAKIAVVNAGTLGIIALPQDPFGPSELRVCLLGAVPQKSVLVVHHRTGSLEVAVSSQPDVNCSLQTAMKFLSLVRRRSESDNLPGAQALLSAVLADRFLNQLSAYQ